MDSAQVRETCYGQNTWGLGADQVGVKIFQHARIFFVAVLFGSIPG